MTMNLANWSSTFVFALLLCIGLAQESDEFDDAVVEEELPTEIPEPEVDIPYTSPSPIDPARVYFAEHFDNIEQFHKTWVKSAAKKEGIEEDIAKYDGVWIVEPPTKDGLVGDNGLVLKTRAKHAAISSRLRKPFNFDSTDENRPLIVQYEVALQDGQECGGAYLKLLSAGAGTKNLAEFTDKTSYTIMFGPDKCGNDHKLHFIFRHRNPLNGTIEEKHCKKPKERLEEAFADKQPHLYTLIITPQNTFEILLDRKIVNSGSLLEDFTPPVNPSSEIDDPADRKPTDWDEREKIPDPDAQKPEDWDEDAPAQIVDENAVIPEGWLEGQLPHIPDPDATKPLDWDSEMDGEWEAPVIENPLCAVAVGCGKWEPPLLANPSYKGRWRAPLIDNPNYRGKWRPRLIPNPDFYHDPNPFKMIPFDAIGFEIWSMSKDILFDNVIITDDREVAEQWAAETFEKKQLKIAKDSESFVQKLANITNEYPALWALYIIVLGIPVTFLLYLCFKPSSTSSQKPEKPGIRRAADIKKTDEMTEDVREEEVEEKEQVQDEDDEAEKNSGPEDEESDEKEEIVPEEAKKEETSAPAPRKRKPRKE